MKYIYILFFFIISFYYAVCQDRVKTSEVESYIINNTGSAFPYKNATAGYILRKLYGNSFNKWVDIEEDRETFSYNYIWSMNNSAEYMIRYDCTKLCFGKPQVLNIALDSWLNPVLDSIVSCQYKENSDDRSRDTFVIFIYNQIPNLQSNFGKDTVLLFNENPWCRAFKYLVIQHIFSEVLGSEFDENCLTQDGSQEANLELLGNKKDYLKVTKEIALELFSKHRQATYMKKAQFFFPIFNFIWDTQLDTIAGKYYEEYMDQKK